MIWPGLCSAILLIVPIAIAAQSCDDIVVSGAWIREPPPIAKVAAGYATLQNAGDHPVTIANVDSTCCTNVAIHQTILDDGQTRMSHIENLLLPAHAGTRLEPGGAHLMLMSPSVPIRHGESVEIEFFCVEGGSFSADFEILRVR